MTCQWTSECFATPQTSDSLTVVEWNARLFSTGPELGASNRGARLILWQRYQAVKGQYNKEQSLKREISADFFKAQ